MSKKKLYKLIVDDVQLALINEALELRARIAAGQLREITNVLRQNDPKHYCLSAVNVALQRLDEVKDLIMGLPGGAFLGIHSPELHNSGRVLYDMHQVIRHRLAWDHSPEPGWDVRKDPPTKTSETDERLAVVVGTSEFEREAAVTQARSAVIQLRKDLQQRGLRDEGLDREYARLSREAHSTV